MKVTIVLIFIQCAQCNQSVFIVSQENQFILNFKIFSHTYFDFSNIVVFRNIQTVIYVVDSIITWWIFFPWKRNVSVVFSFLCEHCAWRMVLKWYYSVQSITEVSLGEGNASAETVPWSALMCMILWNFFSMVKMTQETPISRTKYPMQRQVTVSCKMTSWNIYDKLLSRL